MASSNQTYDGRKYSMKHNAEVVLPGVTGMFCAALHDKHQIVDMLFPQEKNCLTKQDIAVPTKKAIPPIQPVMYADSEQQRVLSQHKISDYIVVPSNSSILQFCVYLNKFDLLKHLLQHEASKQLIKVQNSQLQCLCFLVLKRFDYQ